MVYAPALRGPFLFDDQYLYYDSPNPPATLRGWMSGVRPLLMLTYWLNYRASGGDTFSYHVVNLLLHVGRLAAGFRHRTEIPGHDRRYRLPPRPALRVSAPVSFCFIRCRPRSVAYVASRSEVLSVLFVLAAFTVFLYRRSSAISWAASAGVLALFVAALGSKEHTLVLAGLLLLTDFYWNPGFSFAGIRRNWRVYVPMALAGAAGLRFVWHLVTQAQSAGFGLKDFTWYQYLFTQFRAFFVYLRLMILPYGQTIDYDFPISHTIFEHGAIIGLIAILALAGAAIYYRREFRLASYGFFAYLILMAPTSSILPIRDPIAERRLYLSMIALLLIAADLLRRLRVDPRKLAAALGCVVLAAGVATAARAEVYSGVTAMWEDAVRKTPGKSRAHFQLASAYYQDGRCSDAAREYQRVSELQPPAYDLLVDWALALDCLNQPDEAVARLRQAAMIERSAHVYSQIGMIYAKRARWPEAMEALETAAAIDPNFAMTYVYRGGVHLARGELQSAGGRLPEGAAGSAPTISRPHRDWRRRNGVCGWRADMRIGINALYLVPGEVGGTAIYLEKLLAALASIDRSNRYFLFANLETAPDILPAATNFTLVRQRVRAALRPARILWEQTALPLDVERYRIDVLLNAGFTAPILCGCPQATVFHDLQYARHPEYFRWFDLPFWRALLFWAAHLSRILIADSLAVKQDLVRYYRLPARKVRVANLGVDEDFFAIRRTCGGRDPYLLCISMLHPHKNLDTLLEVFDRFHALRPEFRLVIAGPRGFYERELLALRQSLGLAEAVRFTGWIPRAELISLVAGATAFVYPSKFEGFGLPVLEAHGGGSAHRVLGDRAIARNCGERRSPVRSRRCRRHARCHRPADYR